MVLLRGCHWVKLEVCLGELGLTTFRNVLLLRQKGHCYLNKTFLHLFWLKNHVCPHTVQTRVNTDPCEENLDCWSTASISAPWAQLWLHKHKAPISTVWTNTCSLNLCLFFNTRCVINTNLLKIDVCFFSNPFLDEFITMVEAGGGQM